MMSYARFTAALLVLTFAAAFVGCEHDELADAERSEIHRIFKTGIDHDSDPYVQAETLRVLEMLGDPTLDEYARGAVDADAPMVRVAALRVLLATGHKDVRGEVLSRFSKGDKDERRAILTAALEYGSAPLRREITARSIRSDDPFLRRLAFERGQLARIDAARKAKRTKYLQRTLYPELGRLIKRDDPLIASLALQKFLEVGQTDRAEPLLETLKNRHASVDDRLSAARILAGAHAKAAEKPFLAIIARRDAAMKDDSLAVPDKVVDPRLLRAAVIGAVAAGNEKLVDRAQKYRKNATEAEALEILDALGTNPSADAAVALKVAMQDARPSVRHRAIALYEVRKDADPAALVEAMQGARYETQRRLAAILRSRFKKAWIARLASLLRRSSEVDSTLEMLRNVITTREQAEDIIAPLRETLQKITTSDKKERATLASYLLALVSSGKEADRLASHDLDEATRYAYLEFLVRSAPAKNVDMFRRFFYDDVFVIRLMSAAGLWRAYNPPRGNATKDTAKSQTSGSHA